MSDESVEETQPEETVSDDVSPDAAEAQAEPSEPQEVILDSADE